MPPFVVGIAVGNDKSLAVTGNSARRQSAFGEHMAAVTDIGFNDMFFLSQTGDIYALNVVIRVHEILIGQDNHRHLVPVRLIERTPRQMEEILKAPRREDNPWEFAMTRVECELKVRLFCPCRQAGGGTRPLGEMDDHGTLHHAGEADSLSHKRKTTARRRHKGTRTRIPCANCHIYCTNFVLSLFHNDIKVRGLPGQKCQDSGGWGHWVR